MFKKLTYKVQVFRRMCSSFQDVVMRVILNKSATLSQTLLSTVISLRNLFLYNTQQYRATAPMNPIYPYLLAI